MCHHMWTSTSLKTCVALLKDVHDFLTFKKVQSCHCFVKDSFIMSVCAKGLPMMSNGDRDMGNFLFPACPWIEMIWTGHYDPPFPRKRYVILSGLLQHVFFLQGCSICVFSPDIVCFFCLSNVCLLPPPHLPLSRDSQVVSWVRWCR